MARNLYIGILRGVAANAPTLQIGELYFATDTNVLYIGTPSGNVPILNTVPNTQAVVDFGIFEPTEDTTARVTIAAPWVTANDVLVCCVVEGQDHTDDEISAEQVTATIGNIVPGVSFDVVLSAMNGASEKFLVNIMAP
jgi:hypothetical protein